MAKKDPKDSSEPRVDISKLLLTNDKTKEEKRRSTDATTSILQRLITSVNERDTELLSARDSFSDFCEKVMMLPSGKHLQLKDFHKEVANAMQYEPRFMVLLPRGHMRSTLLVAYACWRLGVDRNTRIIWVCEAEGLAEIFLRQVEDVMIHNQKYRSLFGNLVPDASMGLTWTDRIKIVAGRSPFATHSSLYACGVGSGLIGRRADVIIADDIVSDKNSRTPYQREVLWHWYNAVLMPILEPKTGKLIIAGTRYFTGDLYETLGEKWGIPI